MVQSALLSTSPNVELGASSLEAPSTQSNTVERTQFNLTEFGVGRFFMDFAFMHCRGIHLLNSSVGAIEDEEGFQRFIHEFRGI